MSAVLGTVNTLNSELNSLIDGGNTQSLLDEISTNTLGASGLKSLMANHSPYLSDEVLSAYFEMASATDVTEIHDANKPVTPDVWTVIEERSFSTGDMETLEEQQTESPVSERQVKEDVLGRTRADLQSNYAEKIEYFIHDTLETANDSLIDLFVTNLGNLPDAHIQRVDAYARGGYITRALAYADSLKDDEDLEDLMTLKIALIQLGEEENDMYDIHDDSAMRELIEEFASDSTKQGYTLARAILDQVDGISYPLVRFYPQPEEEGLANNPAAGISKQQKELPSGLQLYPNPAGNSFTLLYSARNNKKPLEVAITDILGKLMVVGKLAPNLET